MDLYKRQKTGKFGLKSGTHRGVKTIRVTSEVWDRFGQLAADLNLTRADLLEKWVNINPESIHNDRDASNAIVLLNDGLVLKANAGGKIKEKIRQALAILEG